MLARHGALKKTSRNRALIEALGQDILGSLDDNDLYETFLDYVRDLKRERRGIREIEVAVALRKSDDEALATADPLATMWVEFSGCETLTRGTGCSPPIFRHPHNVSQRRPNIQQQRESLSPPSAGPNSFENFRPTCKAIRVSSRESSTPALARLLRVSNTHLLNAGLRLISRFSMQRVSSTSR